MHTEQKEISTTFIKRNKNTSSVLICMKFWNVIMEECLKSTIFYEATGRTVFFKKINFPSGMRVFPAINSISALQLNLCIRFDVNAGQTNNYTFSFIIFVMKLQHKNIRIVACGGH